MNSRALRAFFLFPMVGACILGCIYHFYFGQAQPPKNRPAGEQTFFCAAPKNILSENFSEESLTPDEWLASATNDCVASPELALGIARKLLADDPEDEYGRVSNVLLSLCDAGQFATALQLATQSPADLRENWLKVVIGRYAQCEPQGAAESLDFIDDPVLRGSVFRAIVDVWKAKDSASLAGYAMALPESEDREYAIRQALDNWAMQDPAALAGWLNSLPHGVEFDGGAAMMLAHVDGANCSSEMAVKWVEAIGDANLKYQSLLAVLNTWRKTDVSGALDYVKSASWLNDSQRASILISLSDQP